MIVGLSAASLQRANTTTVDVDLWFEMTSDPADRRLPRVLTAAEAKASHWHINWEATPNGQCPAVCTGGTQPGGNSLAAVPTSTIYTDVDISPVVMRAQVLHLARRRRQ